MKSKITVFLLLVLFFSAQSLIAEEVWKITSLDWQPYSGAEMANQGNSIQKLRELLEKEGIKLVVEFYPWKRAQNKASTEEYVGYFPAWPEEVAEGFTASPPIDWSEIGIMKRKDETVSYNSIEELFKNYKVGLVSTYVYPDVINAAKQKYPGNTVDAPNEVTLLKMLSIGRFNAGITDPTVMMYLAQQNGISNIEPLNSPLFKKELVIAFRAGDDNQKRMKLLESLLKKAQ